ncbi:unnamed protein product [Pedinophyceae sp. YPF-701]|nr:unnamed protein product [Pedinophyceae sp. YPF-701]
MGLFDLFGGWAEPDIPSQEGRTVLVTGGNSGLGLETARVLYKKGANVIITSRSKDKALKAVEHVQKSGSGGSGKGSVSYMLLDLSEPEDIDKFAAQFKSKHKKLNLLINNAGVMNIPTRTVNSRGWETQMATNHIGHFLLTRHLLPQLEAATKADPQVRIVNHSSMAHRIISGASAKAGGVRVGPGFAPSYDGRKAYNPWEVYCETKMANVLFTRELNNRLSGKKSKVVSTAAHPGWTATNLQKNFAERIGTMLLGQHVVTGALAQLRAATDPGAKANDYFGPWSVVWGRPTLNATHPVSQRNENAKKLWNMTEQWTGVKFL